MTDDRPWIPVVDQLPRNGWLVETRIGDERSPDLVCEFGVWLRVIGRYDGRAPTHRRLTRPEPMP